MNVNKTVLLISNKTASSNTATLTAKRVVPTNPRSMKFPHSCYEYRYYSMAKRRDQHTQEGGNHTQDLLGPLLNSNVFCFPLVEITGLPKCSTTALFKLLSLFPQTRPSASKENCIAKYYSKSIVDYFESLVRYDLKEQDVLVNGCIDLANNLLVRTMLRNPNTFYVVMVRDYSSWMWSAYNYWCSVVYEKNCKKNKWIDSRHHKRTPELFHDLVTQSLPVSAENNAHELRNRSTSPLSPSVPLLSVIFGQQTCSHAETGFTSYLRALWSYIPPENTLVVASEMLNERPRHVALTLQRRLGLDATHLDIKHFDSFRYNTNTLAGVHQQESVFKYQTGLYKASGYRPMLRETEQALSACWCEDCRWISLLTQYPYRCCGESESEGVVNGGKERNETTVLRATDSTSIQRRALSAIANNRKSKKKKDEEKNGENEHRNEHGNKKENNNSNSTVSNNNRISNRIQSNSQKGDFLDRFREILSLPNVFSLFVRRYLAHHTAPPALTIPFLRREPSHCVLRPEGMDFVPSDFLSLSVREQAVFSPHNTTTHSRTELPRWRERQLSVFRAAVPSHNDSRTSQTRERAIKTFSFDEFNSQHTHTSAGNDTSRLRFGSVALIVSSSLRDLVYVEHVLRYALTRTHSTYSTHSSQRNKRRQRFIPITYLSALHERDQREGETQAQRVNDSGVRETPPLVVDVCKSAQHTLTHTRSVDAKDVDLFLFLSPSLLTVNAQGALALHDDARVALACSAVWPPHTNLTQDNSTLSLTVDRVVLLEHNPLAVLWYTNTPHMLIHTEDAESERRRDDLWGVAANKDRFSERGMTLWADSVLHALHANADIDGISTQNDSSVRKSVDSLARSLSLYTAPLTQFLSQLSEQTLRVFSSSQLNHVALRNVVLPRKTPFRGNYSKSSSLFFFSPLVLPPLSQPVYHNETNPHTLLKRSLSVSQAKTGAHRDGDGASLIDNNALDDAELALVRDLLSFLSVSPSAPDGPDGKERVAQSQADRESVVWASIRAISCVRESFFRERMHRGRYRVPPLSAWSFVEELEEEHEQQQQQQQQASEVVAKKNQTSSHEKDDEQKENDGDGEDDENNENNASKQSFSPSSHTLTARGQSDKDSSVLVNPFLQHDLRFVDVSFYCSLTNALYSLSLNHTHAQTHNATVLPPEGGYRMMSFLTASFSHDHLLTRTNDEPSSDDLDAQEQEGTEGEDEEERGEKGERVHLNTTSPAIKRTAVDRTHFFHRCVFPFNNSSAANFTQTLLEMERDVNLLQSSSSKVFSLTDAPLSDTLSSLAESNPDEERGQCSAMFDAKSFYRTLASLPVTKANAFTPNEKVLMALISRDRAESEQVRVLLEHSTGYYAAVHDLATDMLAFSSTVPEVIIDTIPKCTQSTDRKVRSRERNGLRAFLVQIDSRRARVNLKILPSPNRGASSSSSTSLRRRLDQESPQDRSFKTEMIAPAPITRHRSEVDGFFIALNMQPQLACNPKLQPRGNTKTRVPFQRALVMLPDPFFAFWKKIFSQSSVSYPDSMNNDKIVFSRAQQQVSRRIFSDVATAMSALSPLQMPIVDGRIPGPFGDRPAPAFPHESALMFSYESVAGSLIRLNNHGNASLPSLHTKGYARLLRFIEKDVDIDWESRFTFSQTKDISSLPMSTRHLSDEEIAERGKCALPMLTKSALPASNKLRALSVDMQKMRSYYQSNPMSLCIVHRILSDKFPLAHEQLVLLYDFVELVVFCRSQ